MCLCDTQIITEDITGDIITDYIITEDMTHRIGDVELPELHGISESGSIERPSMEVGVLARGPRDLGTQRSNEVGMNIERQQLCAESH